MYYDLHIHSALSPCANDDMTPNNIIRMAKLLELDCIAICDHNSALQQPALDKVAKVEGIQILYGMEVQTIEDVHVLCYFSCVEDVLLFDQEKIRPNMLRLKNDETFFGNQLIYNEFDEIISKEENLLLSSVQASIDQVCDWTHLYHGALVLAHVLDRNNSITTQLGFIPKNLKFDGIEIKEFSQKERVKEMHPWIQDTVWLVNSDAHQLVDIHEKENYLSNDQFKKLWRNAL